MSCDQHGVQIVQPFHPASTEAVNSFPDVLEVAHATVTGLECRRGLRWRYAVPTVKRYLSAIRELFELIGS